MTSVQMESSGGEFDTGLAAPELLLAGLMFAAAGAVLGLIVSLLLRALAPLIGRRAFIAVVTVGAQALALLIVALIGLQMEGTFGFGFLTRMRWEGWAMLSAAAIAAMLVARRLAPPPHARVDPSVFE